MTNDQISMIQKKKNRFLFSIDGYKLNAKLNERGRPYDDRKQAEKRDQQAISRYLTEIALKYY